MSELNRDDLMPEGYIDSLRERLEGVEAEKAYREGRAELLDRIAELEEVNGRLQKRDEESMGLFLKERQRAEQAMRRHAEERALVDSWQETSKTTDEQLVQAEDRIAELERERDELREALECLLDLDDSTRDKSADLLERIALSGHANAPWCCSVLNARTALAAEYAEPKEVDGE